MTEQLTLAQLQWLTAQQIPIEAITEPVPARFHHDGGLFFPDLDTYWHPKTGQFISARWCLGDPFYGWADDPVTIHETPIQWLQARRIGIVVIRWAALFTMMCDFDRVAVHPNVRDKYQKHMRPQRLPKVVEYGSI